MPNYRVTFYKKADQNKDDQKDEYLGTIVVDDFGLENGTSIVGKAFRQASPNCLMADKTITERV